MLFQVIPHGEAMRLTRSGIPSVGSSKNVNIHGNVIQGKFERTHCDCGIRLRHLSHIRRLKCEIYDQCTNVSVPSISHAVNQGRAYANTAFISMMAIVFPIQACGPAIKDNMENTGW